MAEAIEDMARRRAQRSHDTASPVLPAFLNLSPPFLIKSLSSLAHEISNCPKPSVCQRHNAILITRRVKQLSVLFEDTIDPPTLLPPSAILCFQKLHRILHAIKLLLDYCRETSRLWLLMEHEIYPKHFQDLSHEIAAVLDELPLELLDVPVDVREQVYLVGKQARKSKVNIDPKEERLRLDVFSVMREFARKATPDTSKLTQIFVSLELNNARDCQKELFLLDEEMENHTNTQMVSRIASLISFVRYCKCILYGVTEVDETECPKATSVHVASSIADWEELDADSNLIPNDFKCPISLELMRDPVIVATGQTYERSSIMRWIEDGHSTCPKSGLKLVHNLLIPNYALRSLISQWCKEHNIPFETQNTSKVKKSAAVDSMASTLAALEATKMCVAFLVEKLSTGSPEVKRQVAYELRMFAKSGMDNRMCIGEAGAITHLVALLSSEDARTQENAVTALLNLSIYNGNTVIIAEEAGAVDAIIEVLNAGGCMEARENAAATLFSLSGMDDYKVMIGSKSEALVGLVHLLKEGTPRGKKDAASALFNLCLHYGNREKVAKSGAVEALFASGSLSDDTLAVLAILAASPEGLVAISQHGRAVQILMSIVKNGSFSEKAKENSLAILLALCRYGGDKIINTVFSVPSAISSLRVSLNSGTPRARRKAASLLRVLDRWEFIAQR